MIAPVAGAGAGGGGGAVVLFCIVADDCGTGVDAVMAGLMAAGDLAAFAVVFAAVVGVVFTLLLVLVSAATAAVGAVEPGAARAVESS